MHIVPVYDNKGINVNQLEIDDVISHSDGRVSKGIDCYYKGIGGPYRGHYSHDPETDQLKIIKQTDIFYLGNLVTFEPFRDKSGIFQVRYQPQFDDFINTCGTKELSIIENSELFERSSVVLLRSVRWDEVNRQYFFKLDYKCKRRKYDGGSDPIQLKSLLSYMLSNNWNFVWDKNSISDVSYNGLVTDVADIFHSQLIANKLGTVYSILYSLAAMSMKAYEHLIALYKLSHRNLGDFVLNSIEILRLEGIDVSELQQGKDTYRHSLLNYLYQGRNCGHCVLPDVGDRIKQQYIETAKAVFNVRR